MAKCIAGIKAMKLGLTEAEIMQILNNVPTTDVEIYLIIEECGERLSEEQITDLCELIKESLS
jgi:DNA-directed RNA polymerase subunit F